MALTATFKTDFGSFYDAMQKATVSLESFDSEAKSVGKTLSTMATQFSGKNIIEQGAAINRLFQTTGDLALVTSNELKTLGATATEAIDKMERMGVATADNTKGLRMVADASKEAKTAGGGFNDFLSAGSTLLGAFGVSLSVGAVVSFGKAILADASALEKMAAQTGLTVTQLQQLTDAGDEVGVSIDSMSGSILTLQERVAKGDKNAVWALKELGISFQDFKNMNPGDALVAVVHGLHEMDDPLRQVRVGAELFGKSWKEMQPIVKRGLDDTKDAAVGMSETTVKNLDDAGNAMNKLWKASKAYITEGVVRSITLSTDELEKNAAAWKKMIDTAEKGLPKLVPDGFIPPGLPADLEDIEQKFDADAKAIERGAKAAADWARANEEMASVGTTVAATIDTIDGAVVEAIKVYLEAGVSVKTLADWYALTDTQVKAVNTSMKEHAEIMKDLAKVEADYGPVVQSSFGVASNAELTYVKASIKGFNEIAAMQKRNTDDVMKATLSETDYKIAKIHEWETATINAFDGATNQMADFTAAVHEQAQHQIDALNGVNDIVTVIGHTAAEMEAERAKAAHGTGDAVVDEYRRQQEAFMGFKGVVVAGTGEMVGASEALTRSMTQVITDAGDWLERKFQMEQAQRDRGEFFNPGMGGGMPTGHRAAGGPVSAGGTYVVGEHGPELFTPSTSGAIIPNGAGGGVVVHNTIYVNGSVKDLAPQLIDELTRMMKQTRQWPRA